MIETIFIFGIVWTALYCLIAIGFSLLFGVAQVLNLAHGMIIMSACYITFLFVTALNWSLGPSLIVGIIATVCLMLIIWLGFIKRLLTAPVTSLLLLTAGLANVIQQIVILTVGPHTKYVPSMITGSTTILSVTLSNQQILSIIVAFVLVGLLALFLQRTRMGRAIRAVTQDRNVAALSGINAEEMYLVTIIIAGLLAGVAGLLVAPIQTVTPEIGWEMMVTAFTVTILAGLGGPIWGIIVAAAIVAYAELITAFLVAPMLKEGAAFVIMILTLMFRPLGLFGKGRV
ncbi:MAG: branched-chain amino acid ABC transporter permease [Proteobacteria bacterium]|nr:branched-chain amino acid ABC transporter permease [Pseudomonadota bacterium]